MAGWTQVLPPAWQDWQLTDLIGEGSYGVVYRAERSVGSVKMVSAIKVIRVPASDTEMNLLAHELSSPEEYSQFIRREANGCLQEIEVMQALSGKTNIVNIQDSTMVEKPDADQWEIFIRMEYLTSFMDWRKQREVTEADAIRLGLDMCTALAYCGEKHILHRDIKPSNIFVSDSGDFKLGDFGVSRSLDRTNGLYSAKGTMSFMAPEVAVNKPYDQRADIYSLGMVLYRLMNRNRDPFIPMDKQIITPQDREQAQMHRFRGDAMPPPLQASPGLAKIILKACAYQPNQRYRTAEEMRADLAALAQPVPARKAALRLPKWAWAAAALVLALAIWLAATWLNTPSPQAEPLTAAKHAATAPATASPTAAEAEPAGTAAPVETDQPEMPDTPAEEPTVEAEAEAAPGLTVVNLDAVAEDDRKIFIIDFHTATHSARVPVAPKNFLDRLAAAGVTLTEDDREYIWSQLKNQFTLTPAGTLTKGDEVTAAFTPDDDFVQRMAAYGVQVQLSPVRRVYSEK